MRRLYFIFSIFTLPLLTTVPAFSQATPATGTTPAAQEAMGLSAEASAKAEAKASEGKKQEAVREAEAHKNRDTKPQIITDEKTNTVRVLIGGKEVLTIDAKGLHVHGDLDYSGVITDTGTGK